MLKPSICIFGCGEHAERVLSEKDQSAEFNLYFASRDRDRAKAYSDKYKGLDYFGDYAQALSDNRIDAAYFLTPHDLHLSNFQLASKNGKHVLMEKPIARNLEEAYAMLSEAKRNNIKLMVAENYRYLPAIKSVKKILNAGTIGDIISIEIESKGYSPISGWRLDKDATGGGRFIDGGIHYIDILLNLGGLPTRVYAQATETRLPNLQAEDTIIMIANMPNKVIGLINHATSAPQNTRYDNVLISGTIKQLSFNPFDNEILVMSVETQEKIKLDEGGPGFKEMLDDFRKYITNSSHKTIVSNEQAINDLAVVLATYESMSKSIPVTPRFYQK
jgi:predicted dehydrogenase